MSKEMTPEDFLKSLNEHHPVFELAEEYEYTQEQLLLFAKEYASQERRKAFEAARERQDPHPFSFKKYPTYEDYENS